MNDFIVTSSNALNVTSGISGNSLAAPRVAGAAALIKHKFGTNSANTKQILLSTADDLGAVGTDPVFGRRLLNVGRALSPVGTLR